MLDKNDEKTMQDAMDDVDQRVMIEYGLASHVQYYRGVNNPVYEASEKATFFNEEVPVHIRILMMLDKQSNETLKLIHTLPRASAWHHRPQGRSSLSG